MYDENWDGVFFMSSHNQQLSNKTYQTLKAIVFLREAELSESEGIWFGAGLRRRSGVEVTRACWRGGNITEGLHTSSGAGKMRGSYLMVP